MAGGDDMPAGGGAQPHDAITAARFSITVDGVEIAQFSELMGITSEAGPLDLTGRVLQKLPGQRKPPTVTLKRGMTRDTGIFAWHQSVVEGQIAQARKNCALVMYGTDGTATAKYYLENAWPSKVEISALKAGASEVLYETVTLTCDNIQRVAP
jgi:phage tail-like protein